MLAFLDYYPLLMAAFLFGFSGSGHCIVMCGGLLSAINMNNAPVNVYHDLSFHSARLLAYSFLGLCFGLSSVALNESIFTQLNTIMRLIAALVMMLAALYLLGKNNLIKSFDRLGVNLWKFFMPYLQSLLPINSVFKAFRVGLLWIFLPCGLLYSALVLSSAANHVLGAALIMLAFGLGTTPSLLVSNSLVKSFLNTKAAKNFSAFLLLIFALWVIASTLGFFHMGEANGVHHH